MGIDAVTFDLDETLLSYRRSPEELLSTSFVKAGYDPFFAVEDYLAIFDEYVGVAESIEEVRVRSFARLAREAGRNPAAGRRVAEIYSAERDHANVTLYPGTARVLRECGRRYDLALITNGPRETQQIKLEATDLKDVFQTLVFAGDESAPKPDSAPFERALGALGVPPDRAVHVGNSFEADVRGAVDMGMGAVWVTNGDDTHSDLPDYRVESIGELVDFLPLD